MPRSNSSPKRGSKTASAAKKSAKKSSRPVSAAKKKTGSRPTKVSAKKHGKPGGPKKPIKHRDDDRESPKHPPTKEGNLRGTAAPFKRPFKKRFEAGKSDSFSGKRIGRTGGDEGSSERRSSSGPSRQRFDNRQSSSGPSKQRFGNKDRNDDFAERRSSSRPSKDRGGDTGRNQGFAGKRSSAPPSRHSDVDAPVQSDKVRLNKYIANSGVCSRREADELITMGLISVNGKTITELGYKVNPGDEVRYESKVLRAEKPVYILMNKPKGFLTTTADPQERNTVMQLIGSAVRERIYPVGRLDRNTTGLLLLTNDGDLADKLMHPSYNVKKIYKAELDKPFTKADLEKLLEGVQLEEGKAMVDDAAIISDDRRTVGIEIHIGWNRVVRRIFEALEYQVVKLDRSVYAGLDKKDLPRGQWRMLTREEIVRLKHYK